jgi:hypothetical protein
MGLKKYSGIIIFIIATFCGCIKDELIWDLKKVNRLATVNTLNSKNISNTACNIDCEVKYDGGSAVTQRGVCWSTNPNPTIANNVTNNGTGSGSFTSSITGLNANITYYCRAYATNGVGTAYGNQILL